MTNVTALRLALRANGYSPIPVAGKKALLPEWQKKAGASEAEISTWGLQYPLWSNTGMLTKDTAGFDFDIGLQEPADAVEDLAKDWFDGRGTLLCRFGNVPKRALLLRTAKPFSKIVQHYRAPDGSKHKIEVLCDGQQLVVAGIHPDTRRPYAWVGGRSPETTPRAELPETDEADAREFLRLATEMLQEKFGFEPVAEPNGRTANPPEFVAHAGPLDVDACLSGMAPNGASVNDAQPRAILSLLQKAVHRADVIAVVVDATMAMADAARLGWNRDEEVRCVTRRCLSGLRILHDEYDPATGVIPAWLAGEFHQAWADVLAEGKRPQLSRNPNGFYVRGWAFKTGAGDTPRSATAKAHQTPGSGGISDTGATAPPKKIQVPAFTLRRNAAGHRTKLPR